MELYGLSPDEYMRLDIAAIAPGDLKLLAYYLWCCHEDDELLMQWRDKILLPIVNLRCPVEADVEGENDDEH